MAWKTVWEMPNPIDEGFAAFDPHKQVISPYEGANQKHRKELWIEGWKKAGRKYDREQMEKEAEENRITPESIMNKVYALSADPALIEVIEDILTLIEEKING